MSSVLPMGQLLPNGSLPTNTASSTPTTGSKNMTTTTAPAGFGTFFNNYGAASEALQRGADGAKALSGSVGNVGTLTNTLTQNALDYNAPGKADAAAGAAMGDIRTTMASNNDATLRRNAAMGIRPDSGRSQGDNTENVASALAQVTAGNQARKQVEDTAQSRLKDALSANSGAASMGLALDGSLIDSAYKTELSNRQNELNAAELALRRYSVDKGVQMNTDKLNAQGQTASGELWGQAAQLGLGVLKETGALSSLGDAVSSWWNS